MYQALYRKWRPQTFDQVVGQAQVTDTLKNQVKSGRLSHSYIFIGTRGTGKTTCARILAKAVNCQAPEDGNPCGKCPACLGISDGTVLDVVELDAASNNGVDNVRALREEAVFSPASVRKRVYIIDEVHMLSTSAFNALLKILEEPPEHLMFILATTELQKVPATILSRCQRHSFRRLDSVQIADYLEYIASQEDFRLSRDAAELIARLAEGGVRDALSLLDQCSAYENIDVDAVCTAMGLAGRRRAADMLEYILAHDTARALTEFSAMWMEGKDGSAFLKELSDLVRDVMIMRVAPRKGGMLTSGGFEDTVLKGFAGRMQTAQLISVMETIQRYQEALKSSVSPKTTVELCLISLCDDTLGENLNALRGRVARLEEQLASGNIVTRQTQPPVYGEEVPTADPAEDELPHWADEAYAPADLAEPAYPEACFEEESAEEKPAEKEDGFTPETSEAVTAEADIPEAPARSVSWADICSMAAAQLPPTLSAYLGNEASFTGTLGNNVLRLQAEPGFVYNRINKPAVLSAFASAATALCGREIRVQLTELKKEAAPRRELDELKAHSVVKFM